MLKNLTPMGLVAVGLAACATSDSYVMSERTAARLAAFERTGDADRCLNTSRINGIDTVDERHFLIRQGANQYYLNELSSSCYGAGRGNNRIQYATSTPQLCRNQIIRIIDNSSGFVVGSCSLGDFERVEKIEANE